MVSFLIPARVGLQAARRQRHLRFADLSLPVLALLTSNHPWPWLVCVGGQQPPNTAANAFIADQQPSMTITNVLG